MTNAASEVVQQSIAGGTAMKAGSSITVVSASFTWLTDYADPLGVIFMLIGTSVGIAGAIRNQRRHTEKRAEERATFHQTTEINRLKVAELKRSIESAD